MSGSPDSPVAVSVLREAARRAVAASSIRSVAKGIGVSHGAVVKFLDGAKPQAATMRKLGVWYLRQAGGAHLDEEAATLALNLLVSGFPEGEREGLREQLLEVLRGSHRAAGREPPEWMM